MLNSVQLMGRLAQDPELRTTASGKSVTSFDLAVNIPSQNKDLPPDFIPIVCWGNTADFCAKYLSKGRQIVVEGRISTRKWEDAEGKKRKAVEVTASRLYFADSNKAAENTGTTAGGFEGAEGFVPAEDDDLPF